MNDFASHLGSFLLLVIIYICPSPGRLLIICAHPCGYRLMQESLDERVDVPYTSDRSNACDHNHNFFIFADGDTPSHQPIQPTLLC